MFNPYNFHLQWHITERCNLRCKHCYFDPKFLKNELSLEQLYFVFNQYIDLIKRWNLKREDTKLSITGGEPLIRNDFFDLLEKCYQNQDKIIYGILSNGILLTKDVVKKLKDLGVSYVQVSLEGIGSVNDAIRGKGSFEKAIKGIQLLVEKGIFTIISMTVSQENVKSLPAMVELSKKLGVDILGIKRLVPMGRGVTMGILKPFQLKQLYLEIFKENQKLEEENISLRIGAGCEDGITSQLPRFSSHGCTAAYNSLTVLPNGDVYPCRKLPIYVGNVLKKTLEEIYYNSKKMQEIRNLNNINEECKKCPFFSECLGGAKCMAYSFFGNPFAPDPQCWRLFESLPKKQNFRAKIHSEIKLNKKLISE